MNIRKDEEYIKKDIKMVVGDEDDEDNTPFGKGKAFKANSPTPILDNYSRDLTKMAHENKIDPIVGREKEIERVSQILSRRKKNNPILIGEPGCVDGKTIITIKKISDENGHEIINI